MENRDKVEKVVEFAGQVSEVLAATVGQFHPILEAVFNACSELLSNPDSKEARYMLEQVQIVNKKLQGIENSIDQITREMQKISMNKQNFDREMQILSQYGKFLDFVDASPEYKKKKMEKFIIHYDNTDSDMNLDGLYNAVTGSNITGEPMMETVVMVEQRNRRVVEEFCAGLKKLFVVGIITLMGYAALTKGEVGKDLLKRWQERMEDVEKRMKAAVDECTEKFPEQAKSDLELLVTNDHGNVSQEFIKTLLDSLVAKYDWVKWSIRAFGERESFFFFNWLAGKNYQSKEGCNWFEILTPSKVKVVVSFCVDPKPIDKNRIREEVEGRKLRGDMTDVALSVRKTFPDLLVHAISYYKKVEETNNFDENCYYYQKLKGAYLCLHLE